MVSAAWLINKRETKQGVGPVQVVVGQVHVQEGPILAQLVPLCDRTSRQDALMHSNSNSNSIKLLAGN